jgi:hypothetical protein
MDVVIIERDKDSHQIKEIDSSVKNKFKWDWLEHTVTIDIPGGARDSRVSIFGMDKKGEYTWKSKVYFMQQTH